MTTVFQQFDVLSDKDFTNLIFEKDNVYKEGNGSLIIEKDGTVIKKEWNNPAVKDIKDHFVANMTEDVEKYKVRYTESFIKVLKSIQNTLTTKNLKNPKCITMHMARNNKIFEWHTHGTHPHTSLENYIIGIYYMHPNWDTSYGGQLCVGKDRKNDLYKFDCISNSVVLHDANYGHAVRELKQGYEGDRDVIVTHWVCD